MPSRDFAPVHDPGRPVAPRHWRRIRCWPHTLNNEGVSERSVGRWRGSKQPTHLPSQWVLSTTIRASVTPRANSYYATGATGKVFGFLSTAFSVGGVVAPVIFGWILDNAGARWMFWLIAAFMLAANLTVVRLGRSRPVSTTDGGVNP